MSKVTFTYKDMKITVRASTGRDRVLRQWLQSLIRRDTESQYERYELYTIVDLVVATVKIEGGNIKLPSDYENIDALRDFGRAVLDEHQDLLAQWDRAIIEATYGEAELLMPEQTDPLSADDQKSQNDDAPSEKKQTA